MAVGKYRTFFREKVTIKTYFHDIYGLKVNDPVQYMGLEIGKVKAIQIEPGPKVEVTLEIEKSRKYQIGEDSNASIDKSLTGATVVKISPGSGEWRELIPGVTIKAEEVPSFAEINKSLNSLLADARGLLATIKNEVLGPEQRKRLNEILDNTAKATENLRLASKNANDILNENRDDVRKAVASISDCAADVQKLVHDNQAAINDVIAKIQRVADRLAKASDKLDPMFSDAEKILAQTRSIVDESREPIRQVMVNVRDVAANLKLMSEDLYKHPWKLLNPTEKDARSDNLATAANEVHLATQYIDKSATRLASVADKPAAAALSPQIKQLVEDLKSAVSHLQATQQQLDKLAARK
jgi:phospholipid/cholesterol/gamma-HCH transport system substrate-binding protein